MKPSLTITYSPLNPFKSVYRFDIFDHETGAIFSDTVRVSELNYGNDRIAREAMTPYGFWLQLKKLVNKRKMKLTGNKLITTYFHEIFNNERFQKDPWPFV